VKYYLLSETRHIGGILSHSSFGNDDGLARTIYNSQPIAGLYSNAALELLYRFQPGDYFENGSISFVSDKLKNILTNYKHFVEFIPVQVLLSNQEDAKLNPYWYIHPLELLDFIDTDKSDLSKNDEISPDVEDYVNKMNAYAVEALIKKNTEAQKPIARGSTRNREYSTIVLNEDAIKDRAFFYSRSINKFMVNELLAKEIKKIKCKVKLLELDKLPNWM